MAAAVAIGGGLLCMISLSGGIAYAMSGNAASNATTSNTASSNTASSNTASPGTTTTPPVVSPKEALIATGQAIQVAEVDISTAPPAFTAPTGIITTDPVSYTFSMDIKADQTGPSWRSIMDNGTGDGAVLGLRPGIFITGSDYPPANRIHIVHGAAGNVNKSIFSTFTATPGTYFNLTYIVTGGKLTTYINGVKDPTGEVSGTFNWGGFTPNWKWNSYKTYNPTRTQNVAGPLKVKNVYWFNKGLTDAEIATLTTASTSTTSTFVPEPFNL